MRHWPLLAIGIVIDLAGFAVGPAYPAHERFRRTRSRSRHRYPNKPQPASSTACSGTIATSASAPLSGWKGEEARLYADAHPDMDEAMPKLKRTVRELGGVEPATRQEQLTDLLSKVGLKADDLLHRLPNLACDEVVNETQWTEAQGGAAGCSGEGCLNFPAGSRGERNQSSAI
jgi:hypothetical protein